MQTILHEINEQRHDRVAALLLHPSSLPGSGGIGSFGQAAYRFVDMLARSGYRYWQMLPLEPTGYGDSPYQSQSLFAGNPYLIDLQSLVNDGLLTADELQHADLGDDPLAVDYGKLYHQRRPLLEKAFQRWQTRDEEHRAWTYSRQAYRQAEASLHPQTKAYLFFAAIKHHLGGQGLHAFPEGLKHRDPAALEAFEREHPQALAYEGFVQYLFECQRQKLFDYAASQGIGIIADTPIYIAEDGCDFWRNPELFARDAEGRAKLLGGCPPDHSAPDGQFWGNPVYDWEGAPEAVFAWWDARLRYSLERCDLLRIDHFKGFESFWGIPLGAEKASLGQWYKGPGARLFARLKDEGKPLPLIAEDLGYKTQEVIDLREALGIAGMRIMQFGMWPYMNSEHLPHNLKKHSVYYFGTHDNLPIQAWLDQAPEHELQFAIDYYGLNEKEGYAKGLIRQIIASPAKLACLQVQDLLELGAESRMNTPGEMGCWRWRLSPEQFELLCSDPFIASQEKRLRCYGRKHTP